MSIQFQGAVVFVRDTALSRSFYEDLLEQRVIADYGPVIGFEGFSIWQADHAGTILFKGRYANEGILGRRNLELCFEEDDIHRIWGKITSAGIELVHPLEEQPWGQLAFRFYDPDHHIVEIGEPIPVFVKRFYDTGMSVDEVAGRTSVSREVIEKILRNLDG